MSAADADGNGGAASPAAPVPPSSPPRIRELPLDTVHRIAAGEVVQRPASALKELLENSLDAGAQRVTITAREGGARLLQVQDDGAGVAARDLPLLARRHATSKLRAYEDLETVATLGFRGEALASISYVAHLTVTTMRRPGGGDGAAEAAAGNDAAAAAAAAAAADPPPAHGLRARYRDGELLDPPGAEPVAAVPGTTITVEDLFYNVPSRRASLRPAEEHALLLDVARKYAVHRPRVALALRRHGEARADLCTTGGAATTRLDAIRQVFGAEVAAGLVPVGPLRGGEGGVGDDVPADAGLCYEAEGYVSGLAAVGGSGGGGAPGAGGGGSGGGGAGARRAAASAAAVFVNGRPVDMAPLRRAIEQVYASHNPKATKPFIFLVSFFFLCAGAPRGRDVLRQPAVTQGGGGVVRAAVSVSLGIASVSLSYARAGRAFLRLSLFSFFVCGGARFCAAAAPVFFLFLCSSFPPSLLYSPRPPRRRPIASYASCAS
jgi:DNA mismatch repair protein MLH1